MLTNKEVLANINAMLDVVNSDETVLVGEEYKALYSYIYEYTRAKSRNAGPEYLKGTCFEGRSVMMDTFLKSFNVVPDGLRNPTTTSHELLELAVAMLNLTIDCTNKDLSSMGHGSDFPLLLNVILYDLKFKINNLIDKHAKDKDVIGVSLLINTRTHIEIPPKAITGDWIKYTLLPVYQSLQR